MAERAAHLMDDVFPAVPVRQWVLTVPHRLRYVLAWDHVLSRAVIGVFMRAVLGFLRRRARAEAIMDGRSGAVAIIQRFGAALNVNVHTHALVLDGVFADDGSGHLQFHPAAPLTEEEMEHVLATIARRVQRLLERRGASDDAHGEDPFMAATPVLAGLTAASIDGRTATGPRPGAQVRRCGGWTEPEPLPAVRRPCHAAGHGFDLDAGVVVPARDRARLERVCRYALRPPVAHDRIQWTAEGGRHAGPAPPVVGRDDAPPVSSAGAAGAIGLAHATPTNQPGLVLRRAGRACRVAAAAAVGDRE